jgi:superoxide reductase
MDRRTFLASLGATLITGVSAAAHATSYFPSQVDMKLFEGINRVKDPAKKSALEMGHAPYIKAPATVKAGEQFVVEISIGENIHPMGTNHWIEYIELNIGNEPAGRVDFQPRGFLKPKAAFTVTIPRETAHNGKLTLVARQMCNLHGLWESDFEIIVT